MFLLYYSKSDLKLIIKKAAKPMQSASYFDHVHRHNDCYFTCKNRKPLVKKAEELKAAWIKELEERLEHLRNMKI